MTNTIVAAADAPSVWAGHPFAHLGPGPYRFVGVETTEQREMTNAQRAGAGMSFTTNMCGGTCDHCGHEIWDVYVFRAMNGRTFKVGCDCAQMAEKHTADLADTFRARGQYTVAARIDGWANPIKRARRETDRNKRHVREGRKAASAREWVAANRDRLAVLPHPHEFGAARGETMLDHVMWLERHAGNAKFAKIVADVRKMIEIAP